MHVVFDARIHLNHITGISRYIINVLREVVKAEQNRYTILINDSLSSNDILFSEFQTLPNVVFKRVNLPHFGPVNYSHLPGIIAKLQPDLYHYPHLDAPIVKGIPTIATVHDANFKNGIKKYNDPLGLKTIYFKYALNNTIQKADKILFVSEAMRDETQAYCKQKFHSKFEVIHNGLESGFSPRPVQELEQIAAKYNLNKPFFLFVGQLREHKNIFRIVDAFKNIEKNQMELAIVGYGYNPKLLDLGFPGIRYLGMVGEDDLKGLYQLSRCFVFPSLMEGFGLPILEAMSMGSPVITSNFGATKEIAGDAAILVDPYSVESIRQALQQFNDPEITFDQTKQAGFERSKLFNWQVAGEKLLSLYHSFA